MGSCQFCGGQVLLPFQCPFCMKYFCIEHRLPEKHSCVHAPPRTPLGHWKAKIRTYEIKKLEKTPQPPIIAERDFCPNCSSYRRQAITYGEKFEIFECLECGFEWKVPQEIKKKKKRFWIFLSKWYILNLWLVFLLFQKFLS